MGKFVLRALALVAREYLPRVVVSAPLPARGRLPWWDRWLLRKVRHRGIFKVDWVFIFACAAYNLVRIRNLSRAAVQPG